MPLSRAKNPWLALDWREVLGVSIACDKNGS